MDLDGLLVIDKPGGMTSRDVVNRVLGWFPRRTRIGHAGTLDPLATGILVLCVGTATRLMEYVQRMPKVYRAGIVLGATSDTDDADGTITPTSVATTPTREQVERELSAFVGTIEQVPPAYSAAKVTGRRAYDLARKGKEFSLAARNVSIERIDIINYTYPQLEIVVGCGKGTYIRSLARDLGARLGCGGYIASLRRLEIGCFTEAEAISIDTDAATAQQKFLPPWRAVQMWTPIVLSQVDADKLRRGQRIAPPDGVKDKFGEFAVLDPTGQTFAVVERVKEWLQPTKVLFGAIGS